MRALFAPRGSDPGPNHCVILSCAPCSFPPAAAAPQNDMSGAVKYGDVPALLALSAPHSLWLAGEEGKIPKLVAQTYAAAGAAKKVESTAQQNAIGLAVDWLLAR